MTAQNVRAPRQALSGPAAQARAFTLADISSRSESLPSRYGLHGREGWGKSSLAAHAPKPIFIQTRGETGLEALIEYGQIPETPHFPEIQSWEELLAAIKLLRQEGSDYKSIVIDTLNGAERLCYEFVCKRDFADEWGDRGFGGYQRGYEVALADWRMFLNSLDELRRERKMTIFALIHTKVRTFKNPEGADYDRWVPDMHEKCWGLTHKWLDCVLFGGFEVIVRSDKNDPTKKGKAADTVTRVLYTQHRPAFDAKNRLGLPAEILMGDSASEGWRNLAHAIREGRKAAAKEEAVNA